MHCVVGIGRGGYCTVGLLEEVSKLFEISNLRLCQLLFNLLPASQLLELVSKAIMQRKPQSCYCTKVSHHGHIRAHPVLHTTIQLSQILLLSSLRSKQS